MKGNLLVKTGVALLLMVSGFTSLGDQKAMAQEVLDSEKVKTEVTEEDYKEAILSGEVSPSVPLEALNQGNKISANDMVEEISEDDNLADFGLMIDKNGEIVSIPEPTSRSASAITFKYPGTNILARRGDILVTSDSTGLGLIGHVGIVTSDNYMQMKGSNYVGPTPDSLSNWFKNRSTTKVVRLVNSQIVTNAADWAAMKSGSKWKYEINGGISVLDPNYCSKFVYQAFNRGNGGSILEPLTVAGVLPPYQFLMRHTYPNTDEKIIYSDGMFLIGDM